MDIFSGSDFLLTKLFFQRSLAFIYFLAFFILWKDGKALIGEKGILPARLFIKRQSFWESPSLFFWKSSNTTLEIFWVLGLLVSFLALFGFTENYGYLFSVTSWFFLWVVYLSFVNIGQIWYSFGWESLLLETGFLAIFLGPSGFAPPIVVIYLLRWVCFRNFFGAGLIKLRGDRCWKDLTCMYYYYETQPIPNPVSIYFHRLPKFIHKSGVLYTFFAELICPLGLFSPWAPLCWITAFFMIFLQMMIIASGNLSWLNYISIALCIPAFDDRILSFFYASISAAPTPTWHIGVSLILLAFIAWRSIHPIKNMLSSRQAMNRGYDPFHLVNTYGAFGSITKVRNELVVMGTEDEDPLNANWKEYEFKGKPTALNRRPPLMSPFHWRLDWLMWFAAFSDYFYSPWIFPFVAKLLVAQPDVLALLEKDPFNGRRPKWIKIDYYNYKFQDPGKEGYWKRTYLGEWLPPVNLEGILQDNE